jgi:hypothetical protein
LCQRQPIIDRIADQLPSWKADLLTKPGRNFLVQFVLTGMMIYLAMALEFPAWAYKAINKLRRSFFWRGRSEAKGGHCQVAWGVVCRPMKLGGLGISSLKELGWSLRMRWLWLKKTEPNHPWSMLPTQVLEQVKVLFSVAMQTAVGDGKNTMFWTDRWLHGQRIEDIAPRLFAAVPRRKINRHSIYDALTDRKWVSDIQGALSVGVISEFLQLWDILLNVELQEGVNDNHFWRLAASRKYSAKEAYECFFLGSIDFEPFQRIWKTWAPLKCRFFLWLAAHNKCWTADPLARHGMTRSDKCPLCDQGEETIDHLLISCAFLRQFWFSFLGRVNLQEVSPQPGDASFFDWWARSNAIITGAARKGLSSVIILGAWVLWKHRNRCVFDAAPPSLTTALAQAGEEKLMWEMARAKCMSALPAPLPVV